jgi:uncharacterized protein YbjT (DUF2867 family)
LARLFRSPSDVASSRSSRRTVIRTAGIFAAAAKAEGVQRIVYLGGIISGPAGELSPHLRSRAEVGDILLASGVPTAAVQAAVIIGSGSASFEMLRYLTERLPVMVTPKWVDTRIQPIAVRDVLRYLAGGATLPADVSRRFDIGGPDVLTYAEMMRRYAEVAGLTPRNEVVCSEHDIAEYIPDPPEGLLPLDQAIALALRHTREGAVSTRWSSAATPGAPSDPRGRRDPRHLRVGDALDFWRVEAIEPAKLLRLRAEIKLPGLAWLELSVGQDYDGLTTYSQRAIFQPRGLAGHAYWRSISPFHGVVFGGMLQNITAAAERAERAGGTPLPVTRLTAALLAATRSSRPSCHASKASAISPWSRQNSSGTSVVLNPLATLFSQASFCAVRICMFPPLRMATSLTGGEHHRSFRRKNLNYPLDAWWFSGQDGWRRAVTRAGSSPWPRCGVWPGFDAGGRGPGRAG